jgi:hypothetical protein
LLCVLVDAFRHDYLDEARAPYLAALARDRNVARVRPILGYSDAIRASIFTGRYPDEHGYWMEYCYRPRSSPFGPLARLAPLDRLPNDFVRRGVKFALSQTVVRRLAPRRGYANLSLRHLPFRGLSVFDWTLRSPMLASGALGVPTVFDDLRAAGAGWTYLDSARDGRRGLLKGLDRLAPDTRLVFVYIHQIDMASHVVGLESRLFDRAVRRTDRLLREVVARTRARLGDLELLVFSDHGMSKVERTVAYPALWRHPGFPQRFVFALDATMVRLWDADDDVRELVRKGAPGRFLSRAELRELHLDFRSRLYGDEVYLLEPGTAIFPNFHSLLKPKAMHAYHPDDPDQHGIYVGPGSEPVGETVELVEITTAIRRLLGVAEPVRVSA